VYVFNEKTEENGGRWKGVVKQLRTFFQNIYHYVLYQYS
jgi:hypothetical protein